jgi:hypothetical protein
MCAGWEWCGVWDRATISNKDWDKRSCGVWSGLSISWWNAPKALGTIILLLSMKLPDCSLVSRNLCLCYGRMYSTIWPQNFEFGRGLWWPLSHCDSVLPAWGDWHISLALHCFFHHTACTNSVDCEQRWDSIVSSIANTWHTLPQQGMCLVFVLAWDSFPHQPSSNIGHNSLVKSTSLFDTYTTPHMVRSWQSSYQGACRRREIIEKRQACKAKHVRDNLLHCQQAVGGSHCLFLPLGIYVASA